MRRALVLALVLGGCAHVPKATVTPAATADQGVSLHFIGRFGSAHGCAVAEDRALTCAHVVDMRPFDPSVALYPFLWSDDAGRDGVARPIAALAACDLAAVAGHFSSWYQLADAAPAVGTKVRFVGYDWSNRARAFAVRRFDAKVLRVVAGHVVFDKPGEPGSSGSCVLDEQDRVVAINCTGHEMHSGEAVGRAVGTWGSWAKELLARPAEAH